MIWDYNDLWLPALGVRLFWGSVTTFWHISLLLVFLILLLCNFFQLSLFYDQNAMRCQTPIFLSSCNIVAKIVNLEASVSMQIFLFGWKCASIGAEVKVSFSISNTFNASFVISKCIFLNLLLSLPFSISNNVNNTWANASINCQ